MTGRVRAVLITPDNNQLLTIRRVRPGQEPYSVLPGGGVETGEDLNTALARELREEVAATADIHSLLLILQQDTDRQYFYLARPHTWSASPADRTGPEFDDPTRGTYDLQPVQLTGGPHTDNNDMTATANRLRSTQPGVLRHNSQPQAARRGVA